MTTAAARPRQVLITGAAGKIGRVLREGLAGRYTALRLLDRADLGEVRPGETLVQADICDRAAIDAAVAGVDAIVHLAGVARIGDWDAILADTPTSAEPPYPTAIRHFARGMAHARKGALAEAAREADALHAIAGDPAMAKVSFFDINHADGVLRVADALLRGELLRARGKHQEAITALREAAAAEDALAYNEPADWPLPVRPYLGAALLETDNAKDAAEAFGQDLKTYPHNGWSLFGLAQAQEKLGQADAARETSRRQVAAWQWADAPLVAARY